MGERPQRSTRQRARRRPSGLCRRAIKMVPGYLPCYLISGTEGEVEHQPRQPRLFGNPPPHPKKSSMRNAIARTVTQIRTGHWGLAEYLKRIKKQPDDKCWFCQGRSRMSRFSCTTSLPARALLEITMARVIATAMAKSPPR
jgi:hypothetical protein